MSEIVKTTEELSLAERFKQAKGLSVTGACLLLDCSGSMDDYCEPGVSRWQAMRQLLERFSGVKRIAFSDQVQAIDVLPPPMGGTNMAYAFRYVKQEGFKHVALITDGLPDSEEHALADAKGLTIDIFYVGPEPRPAFLDRLAKGCGGSSQSSSLEASNRAALEEKIRKVLALPGSGK